VVHRVGLAEAIALTSDFLSSALGATLPL